MRISAVRVRQVSGTMPTDGPFWEERLMRPIDIYPDYRKQPPIGWGGQQVDDRHLEHALPLVKFRDEHIVRGIFQAADLLGRFAQAPCRATNRDILPPPRVGDAMQNVGFSMHRHRGVGRPEVAVFDVVVVGDAHDRCLLEKSGVAFDREVGRRLFRIAFQRDYLRTLYTR